MQTNPINAQEPPDSLDAILNTTLALIFALTPQGQIAKFNRACEIVTGFSFEEVKGRQYWELFLRPDEATQAERAFKASDIGYFLN